MCCVLVVMFAGWSGTRWVVMHSTPNDGYTRLISYMHHHIPYQGRHIASLDQTGQFLMAGHASGPFGSWYTLAAMRRYAPDYVIITPHEIQWDYGAKALPLERWVMTHGRRVFAFYGQESNDIFLYRLPWSPAPHAPVQWLRSHAPGPASKQARNSAIAFSTPRSP
jgi:hypothetical protein